MTILDAPVPKRSAKIITYRDYKKFDRQQFRNDLKQLFHSKERNLNYENFDSQFKELVDKHFPLKKRTLSNNESPFMSKRLRKEIMLRSQRRNTYNKNPASKNWYEFRIQRNKCTRMIRDAKKSFYSSLDLKSIKNSKISGKL